MRSGRRAGTVVRNKYHGGQSRQKSCRTRHSARNFCGRFMTGMAVLVIIMSLSFGLGSFFSSAHDDIMVSSDDRYYKSIQIEKGDSLWSIAQRYCSTEDSVYEYMDELATANNLSMKDCYNLKEGDYLVVSYHEKGASY